jgi:hypothetical protein
MSMAAADVETKVSEEVVRRVLDALADNRFDFRTIAGISEQTGLSPAEVQAALNTAPDRVRLSGVPGPNGEPLYAPRERTVSAREQVALVQTAVEKPVS